MPLASFNTLLAYVKTTDFFGFQGVKKKTSSIKWVNKTTLYKFCENPLQHQKRFIERASENLYITAWDTSQRTHSPYRKYMKGSSKVLDVLCMFTQSRVSIDL